MAALPDRGPTPPPASRELLRRLAARYIWWKSRDEASKDPQRVAAQVMNLGDYKDVQALVTAVGDDYLRDVLRNVPSVDVDIDNNVSLRGNSGVVIQINGRPSSLKGAQLGNFLDQLSADAIDHVEIIPNPSAREDAAGPRSSD